MYTALTRPELVSRLVVSATSPVDTEVSFLRWKRIKKAMKIMAEIYENLSEETMALSPFPGMDGRTFEGPTLFISGEREPVWNDDSEIRNIRQLFPNSHFVKLAGASYWPHTE